MRRGVPSSAEKSLYSSMIAFGAGRRVSARTTP
jgi:hypothetical protein